MMGTIGAMPCAHSTLGSLEQKARRLGCSPLIFPSRCIKQPTLNRSEIHQPGKRFTRVCSAPKHNPQNVPDPQVMPQKSFSPEEAVRAQLDALQRNDDPWPNHGIQTMYEFGEDIGGMERSRYFEFSKDLYHFDHFLGQFQNAFAELVNMKEYRIAGVEQRDSGLVAVQVEVPADSGDGTRFTFLMKQKEVGRKEGSWMTKMIAKQ